MHRPPCRLTGPTDTRSSRHPASTRRCRGRTHLGAKASLFALRRARPPKSLDGVIDASIYNIDVIYLSGKPTVIGEIINEGNEDALFGFVSLDALGNSNIKSSSQYIDEIEIDSPVPFNIPIEFEGEPRYGEHDIQITVRYKDDIREEHFLVHDTTISIEPPLNDESGTSDMAQYIIIPAAIAIGIIAYRKIKKRKQTVEN